MKKVIVALTLCVAMLASLLMLVACNSTLVDTSGNYKEATATEVKELLKDADMVIDSNYQVKSVMTIAIPAMGDSEATTASVTIDAIYSYANDMITMSGTVKSVGTGEDAINGSVYMDGKYAYVQSGDQKIKMPANTAGLTQGLPSGDASDTLLGDLEGVDITVAQSGNTVKVKVEDPNGNVLYLVVNDGVLDGIVMNMSMGDAMTMNIEMKLTNKQPVAPSDLDSYVSL